MKWVKKKQTNIRFRIQWIHSLTKLDVKWVNEREITSHKKNVFVSVRKLRFIFVRNEILSFVLHKTPNETLVSGDSHRVSRALVPDKWGLLSRSANQRCYEYKMFAIVCLNIDVSFNVQLSHWIIPSGLTLTFIHALNLWNEIRSNSNNKRTNSSLNRMWPMAVRSNSS